MSVAFIPKVPRLGVRDAAVMTIDDLKLLLADHRKQHEYVKGLAPSRDMHQSAFGHVTDVEYRRQGAIREAVRVIGQNISLITGELGARRAREAEREEGKVPARRPDFYNLAAVLGKDGAHVARIQAFVQIARARMDEATFLQWMEEANAACLEAATGSDSRNRESGNPTDVTVIRRR